MVSTGATFRNCMYACHIKYNPKIRQMMWTSSALCGFVPITASANAKLLTARANNWNKVNRTIGPKPGFRNSQVNPTTSTTTSTKFASSAPRISNPRDSHIKWPVCTAMAERKSNPEIAKILGTSPRTIDKHVERVLAKLNVETRQAAMLRAWDMQRV